MWNKYKYKYLLMFANYVPVAPSAAKNSSEGSNWSLKKKNIKVRKVKFGQHIKQSAFFPPKTIIILFYQMV